MENKTLNNLNKILGTHSTTNTTLLPIARRVAANSIANGDSKLLEDAKSKVIAVNREGVIDSVLNDNEFTPIILEETEEYKKWQESVIVSVKPMAMPNTQFFYLDYEQKVKKSPK